MAFREASKNGTIYAPGYFLANNEACSRFTHEMSASDARVVTANGGKYLPMGTVWPSNDSNAVGLVYEDVDVTEGNMPGSVVTTGVVYEDRLPVSLQTAAKNALKAAGFVFIATSPSVTRPDDGTGSMAEIGVASAAGTNVGDTAITISNYTPGADEEYLYKVGSSKAPTIAYKDVPDATWTEWDGDDDITAATGTYITIISVNGDGRAIAKGSDTVTAKASG